MLIPGVGGRAGVSRPGAAIRPRAGALPADAARAALVAAFTLLVAVLVNAPFLATFEPHGDDYAVLYHSAHELSPDRDGWLLRGWSGYLTDYPEIEADISNFVRPVVNASVYADSFLASALGDTALLTTNYLGHALAAALVYLLARRLFGLRPAYALLATALFAGSTATHNLFHSVAFRGDMLGATLSLGAVLLTLSYRRTQHRLLLAASVALLTLPALFAKETAWALPLVIGWLLVVREGRVEAWRLFSSRNAPLVAGVGLAVAALAAARLNAGLDGIYVADDMPGRLMGVPMSLLNPLRFAATAFFPVETDFLKAAVSGPNADLRFILTAVHAALAVALNGAGWAALLVLALRRRWDLAGPLGAALAASVVPAVVKADPRFMYLSQAFMLPLLVRALLEARWELEAAFATLTSVTPRMAPALVALLLAAGPLYVAGQTAAEQASLVDANRQAAGLRETVVSRIADPAVQRLYLVNAPEGTGLAALRYYARLAGRDDVQPRLVNTLTGDASPEEATGVSFVRDGDDLHATVQAGEGQRFFGYMDAAGAARIGEPGLISYETIRRFESTRWGKSRVADKRLEFTIPRASAADYVIVGFDPALDGVFVFDAASEGWVAAP